MGNGWGGARAGSGPKRRGNGKAPPPPKGAMDGAAKPNGAPSTVPATVRPLFSPETVQMIFDQLGARSASATAARPRTREWCPYVVRPELFGAAAAHLAKNAEAAKARGVLAMDQVPGFELSNGNAVESWMGGGMLSNVASEGLLFLGYPFLGELSQRAEFRLIAEIRAEEMTRKWTKFRGTDDDSTKEKNKKKQRNEDDDAADRRRRAMDEKPRSDSRNKDIEKKIKELDDFATALGVCATFKAAFAQDHFFGISHLMMDMKGAMSEDIGTIGNPELKVPIGNGRDKVTAAKFKGEKNFLLGLRTIEPMWCYPTVYNASNPLVPSWYDPQQWYVMGTEIHKTRLLPLVGRPVADMLKPAYAFGGLAMTQMAMPYVENWLRTRTSVSEMIHAFSVMILHTNLATTTMPGGAGGGNGDVVARMMLATWLRDNMGMQIIDKNTEDFKNVSAPIGGLDELQAQSQEHMASVARIPLVKFTGIQPKGLNATSEGELRAFEETVAGQQTHFRPQVATVYDLMQISLWGERDPDITWDFVELREETPKEKAEMRKLEAETDQVRIDSGVVSQEEARRKLASDPDSGYDSIDPEDVPDLLEEEEQGLEPEGGRPQPQAQEGERERGQEPAPGADEEGGQRRSRVIPFDEWNESDHPRGQPGNAGQFGSGGGGGKKAPKEKQTITAPQYGMQGGKFTAAGPSLFSAKPETVRKSNIGAPIEPGELKKVGAQMGSNPGGVYEDKSGKRFYVKQGKSKAHVRNEMVAAALYDLAGTPTLQYRTTTAGDHIATEMAKLDKDNAHKLSPEEIREARKDFAVHAWLGNWDAVGTGGDNLGTVKGVPTALDLGGALEYRAQGAPKGKAFGDTVGELDTLRDSKMNKDAAAIFGGIAPHQLRESARYVTSISDKEIKKAVEGQGGAPELADKLIARRDDIAERVKTWGTEGKPDSPDGTVVIPAGGKLPIKELNGVPFKAWRPPGDWAGVEGQADLNEPDMEVPKGKEGASGVIIRESDGRTWMVQPKNGFGGYDATFPKGRIDKGLSMQANAIKEAYEESGLKVRITGHAGDHEGDSTMTRYYYAEREGGDPSQHGDESEGVVLAPQAKLAGFLNRSRDKKIAASLGGGGQAEKDRDESLANFLHEAAIKKYGKAAVENVGKGEQYHGALTKKAMSRFSPESLAALQKAMEEGDGDAALSAYDAEFEESKHPRKSDGKFTSGAGEAGGGEEEEEEAPEEGESIGEGEEGGEVDTESSYAKVVDFTTNSKAVGTPAYRKKVRAMIKTAKGAGMPHWAMGDLKKKLIESFTLSHAAALKKGNKEKAANIAGKIKKLGGNVQENPAPKPPAASPAPPPPPPPKPVQTTFPEPTEAEMTKAKKSVPLKLEYLGVQGAPPTPAVMGAIQEFNDKYAGKELTQYTDLVNKVNAFKQLQQKVAGMVSAESAKHVAQQQKANAEAAAKLKEEQAKNAVELKAVMADLGVNENEATGFLALVGMMGGQAKQAQLIEQFKTNQKTSHGYNITPFQAALIRNYVDGGYGAINDALRGGKWTPAQHVYAKLVNDALDKMPKHTGYVTRGTHLKPDQIAEYQPGMVVEERGFTSTGDGFKFGGNVSYKIKATGGRGVKITGLGLQGEKEVLFKAHTFFLVHKVEKKGDMTHIEMEEVDTHG